MAVVLLGMSGFAIWASGATKQSLTSVSRITDLTHTSDAAALALATEESVVQEYLDGPSPELKASVAAHSADVVGYLQKFKRDGDAPDGVFVDNLLRLHRTYSSQTSEAVAAADRGNFVEANAAHDKAHPTFDLVQARLAATSAHELTEAADAFNSLHQLQDFLVAVTAPAFGAGMLLLAVLGLVVLAYQRNADKRAADVEHQALHDSLTGLPNRALFRDRGQLALAAAARNGVSGAVMLLDLDRFKEVNDTLGHDQGDALLKEVAARLKVALRNSDTVARLGGDEFTILLPDVADQGSAMAVAAKVGDSLQQPFVVSGVTLDLEVSIGVAMFPDYGEDIDTLISRADVAMFAAKRDHAGWTAYAPELDAKAPRALSLLGGLRRALDSGDLLLHYQPKADIATSEVVGVEALVRWQHATLGLIPPSDFVPLAERTGLIHRLTEFVLSEALKECRNWLESGLELPVAVNISARNLLNDGFPSVVATLLRKWDIPPRMLQLEITENSMMGDPARVRACLLALTDLQVGLSIDDFGTGYSSLAYLKDLPVRELKIDRSFVTDLRAHPANRTIVNSVISLGQNLGLRVVAEGVEDLDAWRELSELGCDFAQGYYLARPMSAKDIPAWRLVWMAEHITETSDDPVVASPAATT
jgi:diguanylate cyclase